MRRCHNIAQLVSMSTEEGGVVVFLRGKMFPLQNLDLMRCCEQVWGRVYDLWLRYRFSPTHTAMNNKLRGNTQNLWYKDMFHVWIHSIDRIYNKYYEWLCVENYEETLRKIVQNIKESFIFLCHLRFSLPTIWNSANLFWSNGNWCWHFAAVVLIYSPYIVKWKRIYI